MDKQAEAPWKYWAFLSYSHRDKRVADWLHKRLESYRLPKKLVGQINHLGSVPPRLFPVFRDREELPTSSDLGSQIQEALRQSRFIIVIASPHAAASRWVNEEIRYFKSLHGEDRVLCLIADGEPNAASKEPSGSPECFPPGLRFRVAEDGSITTNPVEPIAADIRPDGDGKNNSLLKVVAGLTGLPFDTLRQRERERARKRACGAALGAFAVCAVALGFAYRLSQVEKRQARLEVSHQALGNITKPYSEMRLPDRDRQTTLDGLLAQAAADIKKYRAWLFPEDHWNTDYDFSPDQQDSKFIPLQEQQAERLQPIYQRLRQVSAAAKTPQESMYLASHIEVLSSQLRCLEVCKAAVNQITVARLGAMIHFANQKSSDLNARASYSELTRVGIAEAEKILSGQALNEPILRKVLEDELTKIKEEVRRTTQDPK